MDGCALHAGEQLACALRVFEEVLVHDEELVGAGLSDRCRRPPGQRLAPSRRTGCTSSEEVARCAESTPVGTADTRNEQAAVPGLGSRRARLFAAARPDDGSAPSVVADVLAEPADAFAPDHVVAIDRLFNAFDRRAVAPEDDLCPRLVLAHQSRHVPGLEEVGHDEADADCVVSILLQLAFERSRVGKSRTVTGALTFSARKYKAEGPMMESKRRDPWRLGHLVVEQFHDVLLAAEVVVDTEGAEHAAEQDLSWSCCCYAQALLSWSGFA